MVATLEEPKYELVSTHENFEIRLYEEVIQARVTRKIVERLTPTNNFRIIAGYIFGNNKSNEKISMTAPVEMWNDNLTMNMAFTMPSKYALKELPEPNDSLVEIMKVPERLIAVMKFSGFYGSKKVNKLAQRLEKLLIKENFQPHGNHILAVYDPPTKLPFFRRNEILIPIKVITYSEAIESEGVL
jgi:hypothetical protein